MRAHTGKAAGTIGIGFDCGVVEADRRSCCLVVPPVGTPGAGAGFSEATFIMATLAVDARIEAIKIAARSKASGGRVERRGGTADDAILVWEFCSRRCSLVDLNRDRN